MRILLAQGHTAEAKTTSRLLESGGGVIDHVRTGRDALMFLQTYEYDLIVLDRSLADGEGSDALRRFRAQGFSAPVLMIGDFANGALRAQVLRAGADDVMTKPIDDVEFLARVDSIVRRRNGFARSVLSVGPLHMDMASREVRINDQLMPVTRKEYAILELMALRKGRVIPKQTFLDHLYNGLDGPETRVIDVFVCNLRKKLAGWGYGNLIDTMRGHGYIMRDLDEGSEGVPARADARAPALSLAS